MKISRVIPALLLFVAAAGAQQSVDAVRVVSRNVERKLTLPGEFSSYLAVDLRARINGFVDTVKVDRGSVVKEGEALATLAAPELSSQIAEAENKVEAAESLRAEAQAKFASAQSTYQRTKAAASTPGAVAEIELIAAEKSLDAARMVVQSLESGAQAARSAVQALKDLAAYQTVTAPFEGVITARYVHPGAFVGPSGGSAPMLRLEQNTRLRLVVAVPESDVAGTVAGARMPFTVPAYPGETYFGAVARISHSLESKTRTMPVELDVANQGLRLAPGMYAQVQWTARSPLASLLVPPAAVVATNERQFVIRINDGVTEWVDVTRGPQAGDLVEVTGALRAGDLIARRGTDELRPGTRVQPRITTPPASPAQLDPNTAKKAKN